MRKLYAFALCAGIAGVLAVIYVLLHLEWGATPAPASPGAPAGVEREGAGK